jgi:hypothetical protein
MIHIDITFSAWFLVIPALILVGIVGYWLGIGNQDY